MNETEILTAYALSRNLKRISRLLFSQVRNVFLIYNFDEEENVFLSCVCDFGK